MSADFEKNNNVSDGINISSDAGDDIDLIGLGTFDLGWRNITSFTLTSPLFQNAVVDNIVASTSEAVEVDVKPGSTSNPVNSNGKGVVPVAILTTEDFDASTVDAGSVRFGPSGAAIAHGTAHHEDVDGDSDVDLLMHFPTQDSGISKGDTEACIIGLTNEGGYIEGCDSIKTPGK